jgi:hypothetical protein
MLHRRVGPYRPVIKVINFTPGVAVSEVKLNKELILDQIVLYICVVPARLVSFSTF